MSPEWTSAQHAGESKWVYLIFTTHRSSINIQHQGKFDFFLVYGSITNHCPTIKNIFQSFLFEINPDFVVDKKMTFQLPFTRRMGLLALRKQKISAVLNYFQNIPCQKYSLFAYFRLVNTLDCSNI